MRAQNRCLVFFCHRNSFRPNFCRGVFESIGVELKVKLKGLFVFLYCIGKTGASCLGYKKAIKYLEHIQLQAKTSIYALSQTPLWQLSPVSSIQFFGSCLAAQLSSGVFFRLPLLLSFTSAVFTLYWTVCDSDWRGRNITQTVCSLSVSERNIRVKLQPLPHANPLPEIKNMPWLETVGK